jgi:phosphatidylserine/phosphatidylglycerophosphate/cardiolipin synthase-like enzyme
LRSILAGLALGACAGRSLLAPDRAGTGRLADETVLRQASAGPLELARGELIVGNDAALRSKLALIQGARSSLDAMYYIFSDDYSSSVFAQELIAAAQRGVRVRLLLDYHSNYQHLDRFTMMESQARSGPGSLEVRFFNRPTRNIVMDAAYLTMGCGEVGARGFSGCAAAKSREIERRFAAERVDGRPAAELGVSNLEVGNSGLFLSGLYAKKPAVVALAVLRAQQIDLSQLKASGGTASAAEKEQLRRLGRLYWDSRFAGPFRRVAAKLQLAFAFSFYGETLNPIHDTFTAYLPVERRGAAAALLDWEYLTDYLHHKLLLADRRQIQLGGRNVEDSYHMRPSPLVEKYIFLDTDLAADLRGGGEEVEAAFEALWDFRRMVASTAEVRQHAPNDLVANAAALDEAERICAATAGEAERQECASREFEARALPLAEREARHYEAMRRDAGRYRGEYPYAEAPDPSPTFPVDPGALVAYVENLPFLAGRGETPRERTYGARPGRRAGPGKGIHGLWLAGLENACHAATAAEPQRVVLHQAYFFPPSNLIAALGRMVEGGLDCRHVTVTVLTNSVETTDLNVVNLLARHAIKAFAEHSQARRRAGRSARFEYYEYLNPGERARISLHTKVSVLGPDFLVGSANADVRSYVMDSNNGLLIRRAPQFLRLYLAHLDALLADPQRTRQQTQYFATVSRQQLLVEDRRVFQEMLAKYQAERWLDAGQRREAEERLVQVLDQAYALTRAILAGGREGRARAGEFDRLFKPI